MRISDWSSDVCSSDLPAPCCAAQASNGTCVGISPTKSTTALISTFPLAPTATATTAIWCVLPKCAKATARSEEHTSELQSLMRISYAVFCLKKKKYKKTALIIQNQDRTCSKTSTA